MIAIAIIEDDVEYRKTLAAFFDKSEGFYCSGDFTLCQQAIKAFEADKPQVVLMDIELPGISGVDGTAIIKQKWPEIEVIMLTIHEDNDSVFESLQHGASGYLTKNIPPEELLSFIKDVLAGGAPMSMQIARKIVDSFHHTPPDEELTLRENEILNKLREGKSYQTIANDFFISKSTVKFHIKNIYRKLQVSNKTQLALKLHHLNI